MFLPLNDVGGGIWESLRPSSRRFLGFNWASLTCWVGKVCESAVHVAGVSRHGVTSTLTTGGESDGAQLHFGTLLNVPSTKQKLFKRNNKKKKFRSDEPTQSPSQECV